MVKKNREKLIDGFFVSEWNEFLSDCRMLGYKKSIEKHIINLDREYILDLKRGDWSYLLSLNKEKTRVLDIGSGWGAISVSLSKRCKQVVAMDISEEKSQFLKIRCSQDNIANITTLNANVLTLPFADSSFDVVILNGVLEWAALFNRQGDSLSVQKICLKEARRVLKDNGILYLAIENRFAATLLLGCKDVHTGLRFITLLPRKIANVYSRLFKRTDYRAYTHSLVSYRNILLESGFKEINFFAPLPGYRDFSYLIPLDDKHIYKYLISNIAMPSTMFGWVYVFLVKLFKSIGLHHLIKYFVADYSIFAKK